MGREAGENGANTMEGVGELNRLKMLEVSLFGWELWELQESFLSTGCWGTLAETSSIFCRVTIACYFAEKGCHQLKKKVNFMSFKDRKYLKGTSTHYRATGEEIGVFTSRGSWLKHEGAEGGNYNATGSYHPTHCDAGYLLQKHRSGWREDVAKGKVRRWLSSARQKAQQVIIACRTTRIWLDAEDSENYMPYKTISLLSPQQLEFSRVMDSLILSS